jgi:hypothetical protein
MMITGLLRALPRNGGGSHDSFADGRIGKRRGGWATQDNSYTRTSAHLYTLRLTHRTSAVQRIAPQWAQDAARHRHATCIGEDAYP